MPNLNGWPRETEMDLERGDNQVMRSKEDGWYAQRCPKRTSRECLGRQVGVAPWYECEFCGRPMDD